MDQKNSSSAYLNVQEIIIWSFFLIMRVFALTTISLAFDYSPSSSKLNSVYDVGCIGSVMLDQSAAAYFVYAKFKVGKLLVKITSTKRPDEFELKNYRRRTFLLSISVVSITLTNLFYLIQVKFAIWTVFPSLYMASSTVQMWLIHITVIIQVISMMNNSNTHIGSNSDFPYHCNKG